jgi:hypothetical protein
MNPELRQDLRRAEQLAFASVSGAKTLLTQFHSLTPSAKNRRDHALLEKIRNWMFVPLSLWPDDLRGFGLHLAEFIQRGRELDPAATLMARLLPEAPGHTVCGPIAKYEHAVKAGNYEALIAAQDKFDALEHELQRNPELKADWDAIKAIFDVSKYQNAAGVIRRRLVQERNFRPADWKFSWDTEAQRFQNVFDAFCHKWDLFGMEKDRPLLLKLTVTVTPYGTIIMVPKYWSFDPRRDLKWKAITKLHRTRSAQKQGPKLISNQAERRQDAKRAWELWNEATEAGMKGEGRNQWVMGRLGWDARTDESRLRRLMKGSLKSKV